MKVISPTVITDANMTANIPEVPPADYAGGTVYALGDYSAVRSGPDNSFRTVYKSLQAGNIGHTPASSPTFWKQMGIVYPAWSNIPVYSIGSRYTYNRRIYEALNAVPAGSTPPLFPNYWLDLGPSIKWAMFDKTSSTQSVWPDEISATVTPGKRADTLALLNISASSVNVKVKDGVTVVYDMTYPMVSTTGITDWWTYFFAPVERMTDLFVSDLPNIAAPTIEWTARDAAGGDVKVGHAEVGFSYDIGDTHRGMNLGITNFSRFDTDDFGITTIVPRGYAKKMRLMLTIDNEEVDGIFNFLARLNGTPVVAIGSEKYGSSLQFGIFREWYIEVAYQCNSLVSIDFQAI